MEPVGPAGGSLDGLQQADLAQRFACSRLMNGRVSATGATGTSTWESEGEMRIGKMLKGSLLGCSYYIARVIYVCSIRHSTVITTFALFYVVLKFIYRRRPDGGDACA